MTESEIIKLVKQIIKTQIPHPMMCSIVSTQDSQRASMQRFSTEGPSQGLRMIQPYGFVSRPPSGMDALVEPVNSDPTHLNIVGQFDKNRPAINSSEAALYGPGGQLVYLNAAGHVLIGSKTSANPAVLGDILVTALDQILAQIQNILSALEAGPIGVLSGITPGSPVPTNPAVVTALQLVGTQLTQIQSQFLDTDSTNILSQQVFVERSQ